MTFHYSCWNPLVYWCSGLSIFASVELVNPGSVSQTLGTERLKRMGEWVSVWVISSLCVYTAEWDNMEKEKLLFPLQCHRCLLKEQEAWQPWEEHLEVLQGLLEHSASVSSPPKSEVRTLSDIWLSFEKLM